MCKKKKVILAFNTEFYHNCRAAAPACVMKTLMEESLGNVVAKSLWLLNVEMEQKARGRREYKTYLGRKQTNFKSKERTQILT